MGCVCLIKEGLKWSSGLFWAREYFHECVYTETELVAFALGMSNIALWMFANFPQLYINWKQKSAEQLSPRFLIAWMMGDICNLAGSILAHQQNYQIWTAAYFLMNDTMLVGQSVYYWRRNRRIQQQLSDIEKPLLPTNGARRASGQGSLNSVAIATMVACVVGQVVAATAAQKYELCGADPGYPEWTVTLGYVIAWISGILYACSRWPQIALNYRRKSAQGVSMYLFFCSISANLAYTFAKVLHPQGAFEWDNYWNSTFAFITLGSNVTVFSSLTIIFQKYYYNGSLPCAKYMGPKPDLSGDLLDTPSSRVGEPVSMQPQPVL